MDYKDLFIIWYEFSLRKMKLWSLACNDAITFSKIGYQNQGRPMKTTADSYVSSIWNRNPNSLTKFFPWVTTPNQIQFSMIKHFNVH